MEVEGEPPTGEEDDAEVLLFAHLPYLVVHGA